VFDAVLRRRSVTVAGEELGLTQAGLSNALARLRKLLGDPLFRAFWRGTARLVTNAILMGPNRR